MKSLRYGLGIVVAGMALMATPAFAQKPESGTAGGGAADRSTGGGGPAGGGGGAVDRGTGGGGGGGSTMSSSGGSSGGSMSSGGGGSSFSSPSAGAASSPSLSFGDRSSREFAPRHRDGYSGGMAYSDDGQRATPRSSGPSGGGGDRAVTRGSGGSGGSSSSGGGSAAPSSDGGSRSTSRTRNGSAPEASSSNTNNSTGTREVPTWSRPRGDNATVGQAKDRTVPPPDRNGGYHGRYYSPYYDPYGVYGNYYGSYYYPYGFGMGYGLYSGFGWAPYYGDPFGDPYGGGYGYGGGSTTSYGRGEQGNLKLKIKPRSAKVYVDGYFVGSVDEFDGAFQKLALNTGRHKVEVKADGYETAEFDVLINPEQTVTFQGELKRIQ